MERRLIYSERCNEGSELERSACSHWSDSVVITNLQFLVAKSRTAPWRPPTRQVRLDRAMLSHCTPEPTVLRISESTTISYRADVDDRTRPYVGMLLVLLEYTHAALWRGKSG